LIGHWFRKILAGSLSCTDDRSITSKDCDSIDYKYI